MRKRNRRQIDSSVSTDSKFSVPYPDQQEDTYIHFSLSRVQSGKYCFSKLPKKMRAAFASSLFLRRHYTWKSIGTERRESLGFEKIPVSDVWQDTPAFITEELKKYIVFRFGSEGRMIGYKINDTFYVLWLDWQFKLYDHGS